MRPSLPPVCVRVFFTLVLSAVEITRTKPSVCICVSIIHMYALCLKSPLFRFAKISLVRFLLAS